ncbi:phosphoribosylamine--glycine ligase [Ostreibacterium oceani]|uniref:Phosphoribosylamine--glycine ligase n=1 Tax=Ostreibacterium oceani TaxID=2654998 RepID=A0A6N7ETN3_9GAMM|nr:phosphoribosylamine--glycine ligase [Ostreibacterium oceani]MPV86174.1 phosphoribosylamine--glycine ligase [Ostreibacterium oceani]
MKILIIGAGGREHALAWKFAQETKVNHIYVAPGNAGTATEAKCENIALTAPDELKQFALDAQVDLTIVGSEALLAEGIVDDFQAAGLAILGPHQRAAALESSKAFAKTFMQKYGVKTADYQVFTDAVSARAYLQAADYPIVLKADGLAAGKGVIIAEDKAMALAAVDAIMTEKIFNDAGDKLVIEQFIQGVEASLLCFTDGRTILPLKSAKDHKKIGEGETGLNTGGMGVICPNPYVTDDVYSAFVSDILAPTLSGLQTEQIEFSGVIFFGLMINADGVYLLEYNMRMGDPETQAVLPLLNTPLTDLIQAALDKQLDTMTLDWQSGATCCVVAAANGYPESYRKGDVITGLNGLDAQSHAFIAGAEKRGAEIVTSGGRVLNILSRGDSLSDARRLAYENLQKIHFDGMVYRQDIGDLAGMTDLADMTDAK